MALRELTPEDFEKLKVVRDKWLEDAIQMYIAWRVHKKPYREIGREYGISHQMVSNHIHSLIGAVNMVDTQGKIAH